MKRAVLFVLLAVCFAPLFVQAQEPLFFTESTFPVYQPPNACTGCTYISQSELAGDFNGDGIVDLAYTVVISAGTSDEFLVVAFGQPSGVPRQIATDIGGCAASRLAAADVNKDGHLDVVILCNGAYSITLLGNGDGTFQPPVGTTLPGSPNALVLADFNGDGLPDLAVALTASPGFAVLPNTGGGHFGTAQTFTVPSTGYVRPDFAAGDFNGDGKTDLFFGGFYILGNGNLTFGPVQTLPFVPFSCVIGDFNEDGYDDIAVLEPNPLLSSEANSPIYLLEGGSSGLSSNPVQVTDQLYSTSFLGAFKLGNSVHLSLVMNLGDISSGLLATGILAGHGDGTFSLPEAYAGVTEAFADMNGDGVPDMVQSMETLSNFQSFGLVQGSGDGSFQGIPFTLMPNGQESIVSDMNGDGLQDVIGSPDYGSAPQVFLSAGNGRFLPGPQNSTVQAGDFGSLFAAADFNGDGKQDVVSISNGCQYISCGAPPYHLGPPSQILSYLGSGTGALTYVSQLALGILDPVGAVTGTFGNKGHQDIVVAFAGQGGGTGGAIYVAGNGDGTFAAPVTVPLLSYNPISIVSADLNGDNKPDLVIADAGGTVTSYLGNGDGTFSPVFSSILSVTLSASATSTVVTDVTGDGIPDLICISQVVPSPAALKVFEGKGDGTFAPNAIFSSSIGMGLAGAVSVGDLNGDGLPDIAFLLASAGQNVQVYLNRGAGVFAADPTLYNIDPVSGELRRLALMRVNRNADESGNKANLDAVVMGPGVESLINLNNPAPPAPSALSLSIDGQTNLLPGQTITFYATLMPSSGDTNPSGTITFVANGTQIGTASLLQDKASIIYTIPAPGSYTIQANYSGDTSDGGASASLDFYVQKIVSTASLAATTTTAAAGTAITFTATVSPAAASGVVTFFDGANTLGQATLASGIGTFTTSSLAVGSHSITAMYAGDANSNPSTSSPLSVTILSALASPTLQLAVNGSTNVLFGQIVTLNATLTPDPQNPTPTGTVAFFVNSVKTATSNLVQNQASAQIPIQSTGTLVIQAVYSGDAADNGANATLNLTAAPQATTVALTASATSAAQGVPLTLTATLAPTSATGTVTFSDGTAPLGQQSISGGVATFTTSTLAVGSHSITAAYGGDADNAPSTSSALTISISAPSLLLSANPSSLSIAQGGSGSTTITATPTGSYSGTLTFGCSGLPANASCTFSPASLTFSASSNEASQTTNLTIRTDVAAAAASGFAESRPSNNSASRMFSLSVLLLPTLLFVKRLRHARAWYVGLFLLSSGTLLLFSSCGGGSSGSSSPGTPVTPVGTSTVVITTSGSGAPLNLSLTVSQ